MALSMMMAEWPGRIDSGKTSVSKAAKSRCTHMPPRTAAQVVSAAPAIAIAITAV
jgi:hypothetical protein